MSSDPDQSWEDMSDDDNDGEEGFEELELPPPAEHTMVLDAVDLPPPGDGEGDDEDEGPEDVLDDSDLDDSDLDDSDLDDSGLADEEGSEFGGPEDGSEEQPFLVVGASGSDEGEVLPGGDESSSDESSSDESSSDEEALREISSASAARLRETPLRGAYEYLTIRTPIAEFESYAGARTEALVRLGKTEEAEIAALALRLGADALRRVMGALPRDAQ